MKLIEHSKSVSKLTK